MQQNMISPWTPMTAWMDGVAIATEDQGPSEKRMTSMKGQDTFNVAF